jgi:hypothetical protein
MTPTYTSLQETYLTYSYSPTFLEDGTVGGIYATVNETTSRVIGERQLRFACSPPYTRDSKVEYNGAFCCIPT